MITENIRYRGAWPMTVRHILFPTDFSDMAKATEAHVTRFAAHFGARITTLHVIDLPAAFYGMSAGYVVDATEVSTLQDRARHTIKSVLPGADVERVVQLGDSASVIAEFAEANGVDLIMMPTHGYGPFRRALLGSVTANVLHTAKCPVWTMTHAAEPAPKDHMEPNCIVCAIDLVAESVHVIQSVADLAKSFGATVCLAHAVPQAHSMLQNLGKNHADEPDPRTLERQNYYTDHACQEIARLQAEAGTEFSVSVHAGAVAPVIAEIARKHEASLVITGRGAVEHFLGTVRSHTCPIIYEAPCPVLSL
jgi:nucleotide-binding universal stress UspA family protein